MEPTKLTSPLIAIASEGSATSSLNPSSTTANSSTFSFSKPVTHAGHTFTWIELSKAVVKAIIIMPYELKGADGVYKVFKVAFAVLNVQAYRTGQFHAYPSLSNTCISAMTAIDSLRIIGETYAYMTGPEKKEKEEEDGKPDEYFGTRAGDFAQGYYFNIIGMSFLGITNAMTSIDALRSWNLIDLGGISAGIGKTVLKPLVNLGLENATRISLVFALLFMAAHAIQKMNRGKNYAQPITDLIAGVSEGTYQINVLAYGSSISSAGPWNIGLGFAAAITSFTSGVAQATPLNKWTEEKDPVIHKHNEHNDSIVEINSTIK